MKKAAIYGQSYAISSEKEIKTLLHVLEKNKIDFYIESEFYNLLVKSNVLEDTYKSFVSFNDLDSSSILCLQLVEMELFYALQHILEI